MHFVPEVHAGYDIIKIFRRAVFACPAGKLKSSTFSGVGFRFLGLGFVFRG